MNISHDWRYRGIRRVAKDGYIVRLHQTSGTTSASSGIFFTATNIPSGKERLCGYPNNNNGDSITVLRQLDDGSGERIRVRLYGIDAPETDQPFGRVSGRFVHDMIYGKEVTIQDFGLDRYKRSVGIVTTDDGVNVNERLVEEGLAWVYGYFCREPICDDWELLEERARELGLGLWDDEFPVAPWDWRRRR